MSNKYSLTGNYVLKPYKSLSSPLQEPSILEYWLFKRHGHLFLLVTLSLKSLAMTALRIPSGLFQKLKTYLKEIMNLLIVMLILRKSPY